MILKVVGAAMLLAVFGGLFAMTVSAVGWKHAVVIWCASMIVTAIIVGGVWLILE